MGQPTDERANKQLEATMTIKKAIAPAASPAKASPAKAAPAKALAKKAAPKAAPVPTVAPDRLAEFSGMVKGLTDRVEALEATGQALESRMADAFERMCDTIAALQLTLAKQAAPVAVVVAPKAAPVAPKTAKTAKTAPANTERGTYAGPDPETAEVALVLDYLADCIIANEAAGFVNEKIMQANPSRMRRYLRTNENKAFRAMREANDLTLGLADDMLDAMFA